MQAERRSFVGTTLARTNALSTLFMDWAGNPYGTYEQEEQCIHCGKALLPPPRRSLPQKTSTKLGFWSGGISRMSARPRPNWMHLLMRKQQRP
jgi:hypothetical protein